MYLYILWTSLEEKSLMENLYAKIKYDLYMNYVSLFFQRMYNCYPNNQHSFQTFYYLVVAGTVTLLCTSREDEIFHRVLLRKQGGSEIRNLCCISMVAP